VFLRNTRSGWYYQTPSQWTPQKEAAYDFQQSARAVERVFENHLENVEILLCYDDPRYDLVLAVPKSESQSSPSHRGAPRRHPLPREGDK
jgi:hypothetical protein